MKTVHSNLRLARAIFSGLVLWWPGNLLELTEGEGISVCHEHD
jgi:hypothetical protein